MRRSRKLYAVLLLVMLACGFAIAWQATSTTQRAEPQIKIVPGEHAAQFAHRNANTPSMATPIAYNEPVDKLSLTSAQTNARNVFNLRWTFGGKAQRGWYLYAPLINELIHTDADLRSTEFAGAVARWQSSVELAPTGVINEETLMRMARFWQERRRRESAYPTPDRLVTAPSTEFWDPQRPEALRQVERETYDAYKQMLKAACADESLGLRVTPDGELAPDERRLRIISAFRSREYQQMLRKQSPHSGRAGLAVNSPHFTGRALDIYVGGEPVDTKDANRLLQTNSPVYRWLVRNAERFGFRPYFYEPWHWEYTPATQQELTQEAKR